MGGIAGIFYRRGAEVPPGLLERQSGVLAHRGPAGASLWSRGALGLVHRRDGVRPSVHPGGQPAEDTAARLHAVCNGRIFNALEISESLADAGIRRKTGSILETMLLAYAAWGEKAFARFNGAFACAIWDERNRRLVLARDQLGIKPLYYLMTPEMIVFGSEPKAILIHPGCCREPDETRIAEYLTWNRFLLLSDRTFYKGISRLMPAGVLTVDETSSRTSSYWEIDPDRTDQCLDDEENAREVRSLLVDAVRRRLPEGEDVGAALSGGFDSSSVVCLAGRLMLRGAGRKPKLKTFSFEFGTDEADESDLIRIVAGKAGSSHHSVNVLTPDFFDDLDDLIRANDGPTPESSTLILWKKKRLVRQEGMDVLLSGLGGDELFMGRLHYFADLLREGRLLDLYREIKSVYPHDCSTGKPTSLAKLLRGYLVSPLVPEWARRIRGSQQGIPFPPEWMSPRLVERTGVGRTLPKAKGPAFSSSYLQDCHDVFLHELVGAVIPFHDVTSSAFSVDTRFPMLDLRLVEKMFSVPRRLKVSMGRVRIIQKQAMAPFLPREVMENHLKKDFHPALNRFSQSVLRERIREFTNRSDHMSREYLDWGRMERFVDDFLSGRAFNPHPIWMAINLERWLRMNFGIDRGG